MTLSTLVTRSARHPRRTMAVLVGLVVVAAVAIGALLGGAVTMEGNPTNNPQSPRAEDVLVEAFSPTMSAAVTDLVVGLASVAGGAA
jgi:hypothetical protein